MTASAERLDALRAELERLDLDGFVLPRGDEHLGEYVAPCSERLFWLTGFTGSAGVAVVLSDRAAVFSDGRYTLQLAAQTDPACFEALHSIRQPPETWLAEQCAGRGEAARIGYDPWLLSEDALARYRHRGAAACVQMVPVARNPVDAVWHDRPAPPLAPAVPHPLRVAGRDSAHKREEIAAILRDAGEDAAVLTDPASVNWLLNIRGGDIGFTPFALGFCLLDADGHATLFMAPEKLDDTMRAWLGNGVSLRAPDALGEALGGFAGRRVRVDPSGSAAWFAQILRDAGATVSPGADPCALPKARKNDAEQDGMRQAHLLDAVAMCGFLHFVSANGVGRSETELSEQLDRLRARAPAYRGESFPAISGTGPNGAIIHYRADPATARCLGQDEVYLIDSGGQYESGTTDITRTLWSGPGPAPAEVRDRYTRVLQGHIGLSRTRFPRGVHGGRLDAIARGALWQAGLDYDHGTGHGVGSCLSVHEGPCGISPTARPVPLEPGMVLSNEPGFYLSGGYGIRLENLVLVTEQPVGGDTPFLGFEPLTLVPFGRALIAVSLLTPAERDWIDRYHEAVLERIGPLLDGDVRDWLVSACAPLQAAV